MTMPASHLKIAANRRNARRSTGPRTPSGKTRAAMNARRHGLFAREVLLPGEDTGEWERFHGRLLADLAPKGELECLLAERVAVLSWRLKRVTGIETGLFIHETFSLDVGHAESEAIRYVEKKDVLPGPQFVTTTVKDPEKLAAALARAAEAQKMADGPLTRLSRAFARDGNAGDTFTRLSRYEAHLERALYRALHELERRQAARCGQVVAPPNVLDVMVSGDATTGGPRAIGAP